MSDTPNTASVLRLRSPSDVINAVPYLLGFHAVDSLVIVGLNEHTLIVTMRLDLADVTLDRLVNHLTTMKDGGTTNLVAVTYGPEQPETHHLVLTEAALDAGLMLTDHLRVDDGHYWSYSCRSPVCCPPEGRPVPDSVEVAAEFTAIGVAPAADREALGAQLDPIPDGEPGRVSVELLNAAEAAMASAFLAGRGDTWRRSAKRALFAEARRHTGSELLPVELAARFGVALRDHIVRDALWMAFDGRRLEERELFRTLGRQLPGEYRAAPLFLYGWGSWRAGNAAVAALAAGRAVQEDPKYSAADLLLAALARGVNPKKLPRLHMPRTG